MLRSARSARLEAWPAVCACCPPFETGATRPPQGEVVNSSSDDLGQQLDQVALFLHVERLQCLARDGRSVDQQLVHQALAFRGEAEQGAARVAGVGTRIDPAAVLEPTPPTLPPPLVPPPRPPQP